MFGYNPYGYGLLSQMPMQQAPQIVQQPLLSAARGIGSSLPDYATQQLPQNTPVQSTLLGPIFAAMPQIMQSLPDLPRGGLLGLAINALKDEIQRRG
jgi:hypothetical protein